VLSSEPEHIALYTIADFALLVDTLKLLAREVQPVLHFGPDIRAAVQLVRNQNLPDLRHRTQRHCAQRVGLDGHVAPRQNLQIVRRQATLQQGLQPRLIGRQKYHANAQQTIFRQLNSGRREQQLTRHRRHQPHPIAALAVGRRGAAMRQPRQRRQRLLHDCVGRAASYGRNESHATRVMVEARIDQRAEAGLLPGGSWLRLI
jgi:hypothetical protein